MRGQLHQEMFWPTDSQKQFSLMHNMDSMEVIVSNPSFLAVQGLSAFGPTGPLQGVSSKFTWD